MKTKTKEYEKEILDLRSKGSTYRAISLWLAETKGVAVTDQAIRYVVTNHETTVIAKKKRSESSITNKQ